MTNRGGHVVDLGARAKYRVEIAIAALEQLPPNLRVAPVGALPPALVDEYLTKATEALVALREFLAADPLLRDRIPEVPFTLQGKG